MVGTTYAALNRTKKECFDPAEKWPRWLFGDGSRALSFLMTPLHAGGMLGRWHRDHVELVNERDPAVEWCLDGERGWVNVTAAVEAEWNEEFPESPMDAAGWMSPHEDS